MRKGFTLIELLVVIGVILVLVGMAVVGYNQLDRTAAGRATRVTLHTLASMEAELDAEAGPDFLEGPQPPAQYPIGNAQPAPGDVNPGQGGRSALSSTVIGILMRSPKNKDALAQLPSKTLYRNPDGSSLNPPALVDAWNNPIMFVPSGGLTGVKLMQGPTPGATTYTIRSSGVYPEPLSAQNQALSPKDRPFWASAGQDGNFQLGDDNIYSFQN